MSSSANRSTNIPFWESQFGCDTNRPLLVPIHYLMPDLISGPDIAVVGARGQVSAAYMGGTPRKSHSTFPDVLRKRIARTKKNLSVNQ